MADPASTSCKTNKPPPPKDTIAWSEVLRKEHGAINLRRKQLGRGEVAATQTVPAYCYGESGQFDTVGLALSGGGIRSAAFCLGASQALAEHGIIANIDYLSTVSGGGYTGAAITSHMSLKNGEFPFKGEEGDLSDPQALGHIRDFSNYLIPRGSVDILKDAAIIARGLVANLLAVIPCVLIAAGVTVLVNPDVASLATPWGLDSLLMFHGRFAFTRTLAAIGLALFCVWAIYRSRWAGGKGELTGLFIWVGVVFCASSRMTKEFASVRPRMKASGATSISPEAARLATWSAGSMS